MTGRAIAVVSSKGGSGKTTVAATLGVRAAKEGSVALLDLDPQQALARWAEIRRFKVEPLLAEMEGRESNPKLFTNVQNPRADVDVLKEKGWDWIIIDTPPAMMEWIEAGVLAADLVLIPVRASPIDLESNDVAIEFCEAYGRPFAFLLTHYDKGWKLSKIGNPGAGRQRQGALQGWRTLRSGIDKLRRLDDRWPDWTRVFRQEAGRRRKAGGRRPLGGDQEARENGQAHKGVTMAEIIVDVDDTDLSILRAPGKRAAAAPTLPPRTVGGNTIKSRARAEKPSHLDGRRQPKAKPEGEVALNIDVAPAIKQFALRARAEFGMPMKQFVAKAIEHYWRALELEQQSEAQNEEGQ